VHRLALVALIACAHAPARVVDPPSEPATEAGLRRYTIWLAGARVGTAIEREAWSPGGVVLHREETMRFLRGGAAVEIATTIEVAADTALVPHRVSWTERVGPVHRPHGDRPMIHRAEATREVGAWTVLVEGGTHTLPANAIPAELAPLYVRRDGRFAGEVFLPARGFIAGTGRIDPVDSSPGSSSGPSHRLVARLRLPGAMAEATIDLDRDGMPARVIDGDGVIAIRATEAQIDAAYSPVDLIDATSLPIAGHGATLVLDGDLALPPLPGQSARPSPSGIEVQLSAELPGALPAGPSGPDRSTEIAALVGAVQSRIEPDLAAGPTSASAAPDATAGDCTTFALAYAALAAERAIPTRVVTGFRVDGDRLIRHRWDVSWTGRQWIAIDAAFGAAPAGGDLVGLAVHDANDAGLVAGEATLTRVRSASRR
jgi:Transglutaminase-like superfamily